MNDQTIWFSKQKKVCAELHDPILHRRIKKCLKARVWDPNLFSEVDFREPDYGLMMLHILCPRSFNNTLLGYEGDRPHPMLKIGSLVLQPFPNYHQRPSIGGGIRGGIRVVKTTKRNYSNYPVHTKQYFCPAWRAKSNASYAAWRAKNKVPLEEVIDAINVATGADIGGRQVEGLDKMSFTEAYNTFMKLSEFEEEDK